MLRSRMTVGNAKDDEMDENRQNPEFGGSRLYSRHV